MGVTPNSCASRRIVTASSPSSSAIASARSTTASRLSSVLTAVFALTLDNYTPYRLAIQRKCTVYRRRDHLMTISRPRWTLLAVSLATFMTYLDNNIVNVAMPAIQRDLHLSTAGLEWVVSGYILVF